MKCVRPLQAFYHIGDNNKKILKFRKGKRIEPGSPGFNKECLLEIPCGQCVNCRIQRAADWATRIIKELTQYEHSCFLTLTYDDEHLPSDKSLNHKDVQEFMMRLRDHASRGIVFEQKSSRDKKGSPRRIKCDFDVIRYYCCGEYGGRSERPHYHAIMFGCDFYDKELYKVTKYGNLFRSEYLDKLWKKGGCIIGSVSYESAAYCARYCLKKVTGKDAKDHYKGRKPEYAAMSKGIGKRFFDTFKDKIYLQDGVVAQGKMRKPPRYFDRLLELEDPEKLKIVKGLREESLLGHEHEFSSRVLESLEKHQEARANLKLRSYK